MNSRPYRQAARAEAAQEKTERILAAALELFVERPFDQITLAAVAERAGVGLQTLIRRVGSKDGLVEAVHAWVVPQVEGSLGAPVADPAAVADAMARHNQRWGALIMRTLQQEDVSPAMAASAEGGRAGHRAWIAACFAPTLQGLAPDDRRRATARLVALTGAELWTVLTRDEGLTPDEARAAVHDLIIAALAVATPDGAQL